MLIAGQANLIWLVCKEKACRIESNELFRDSRLLKLVE
jgi:hypothetical protein